MTAPDDEALFDEAVNHAIRLGSSPDSAEAQAALRQWLARSPDHARIWQEVAEIHGMTGQLLGRDRGITRRRLLALTAISAGAAGAGALFGPGLVLAARADHLTSTAEIRRIALPDGSGLTLGPDSAIAMDFAAGRRAVTLLSGMAACTAAAGNPPLSICAGPVRVLARASAISISTEAGEITVTVDAGEAEVAEAEVAEAGGAAGGVAGGAAPVRLSQGDWLSLGTDGAGRARGHRPPGDAAAWQNGLIIAEAERVDMLVARIARWIPGRVVITSRTLGRRRVSGVFDLSDPEGALAAAVRPHGGRLRQITPFLTLIATA